MTNPDPEQIVVNDKFLDRLDAVRRAEKTLRELRDEVERIDTGLTDDDVVRLLYGRRNGLTLSEIEGAFEGVEKIPDSSTDELLKYLVAQFGNTTLDDAETFVEQVNNLRERYGDGGDA